MIIEVRGTSTRNRGAELMLRAITEHYAPLDGNVRFVVDPSFGSFDDRARYGLRSKLRSHRLGRSALAIRLLPAAFCNAYGLVRESSVDVVLDASGFAFGDQCGAEPTERLARSARQWRQLGKRVILLPQALGSFTSPRVASAFRQVIDHADLIYARDRQSYEYVQDLGGPYEHVKLAPDFTNLVPGRVPPHFETHPPRACIVPNYRMVDKTNDARSRRYVPFLASCIEQLAEKGMKTFLLLHDANVDHRLVEPLESAVGQKLDVVRENDPVGLKGILGAARLVVGSRYHALVGALSQGVPCLASGWSHKYKMLFEDYRCAEMVMDVDASKEQIREALDRLCDEPERSDRLDVLQHAAERERIRTVAMWSEIDKLLAPVES